MPQFKCVSYERLDGGEIVRILLNRPDSRNAQNRELLIELDELLLQAEADDAVLVVILGGVGPIFSSGHDMGSEEARTELEPGPSQHPTTTIKGGTRAGSERLPRCHGWCDLATGLSLDTVIIFLVRPTHFDVEGGPKWHRGRNGRNSREFCSANSQGHRGQLSVLCPFGRRVARH